METKIELKTHDIKNHKDAKVVEFVGDLDATNVESVLEQITTLFNDGFVKVVADFEKLRYVNSTGLGILLHFSKTAKERDGNFKIANVNENVYEIIEIIGAITLLDIYENVNDAIQSL
ncbi:MAG: STAS domain-containing protein [Elusimicrobiota bacterium]